VTVANHAELISFKGFGKTFVTKAGDLRAATDIDLAIRQGEFVTLVGPSGCGKSTLLNAAAGLFPPTDGQVLYRASRSAATTIAWREQRRVLLRC
jgi:NitT/TauT family transport system ATP-binding protein